MNKTMSNYEMSQAKSKLERDLDRNISLLNAWKSVTRNYKKNGESFANLKQNFNGVTVCAAPYSMHDKEKEIHVNTKSNLNGYISDFISNSECVRYSSLNPSEDRIIKESFLEPYFYLTADEIQEKINIKIAYYEKRVQELNVAIDGLNQDLEIMANLLDTMANEISKMNCDMASWFKENIIRKYY